MDKLSSSKNGAVTDEQVAALRAFLAFEPDEGTQLTKHFVDSNHAEGFGELVYAAFVTGVRRRFVSTWTIPDIIRFVATVRARLIDHDIAIDPRSAEILIRRSLGGSVAAELDAETRTRAQIFLLAELIADEDLDDAGLDDFLAQARTLADRLIA